MTAATRIIESQVLSWGDLDGMGDLQVQLKEAMGMKPHIGILRCATEGGKKVTFAGDAAPTSELVSSGGNQQSRGDRDIEVGVPRFDRWVALPIEVRSSGPRIAQGTERLQPQGDSTCDQAPHNQWRHLLTDLGVSERK